MERCKRLLSNPQSLATARSREQASPYRHTAAFQISIPGCRLSSPTAAFSRTAPLSAYRASTPKTSRRPSSTTSKKMLKKEGKINDAVIENMLSRRHTGFHIHVGRRTLARRRNRLGNLAKYIVRTSFSQEHLVCIPCEKSPDGSAKVAYQSKDGRTEQTFDALDRLARLVVPIPNRYEQLAGYGGYYSNKSRGMRKRREPTTSRRRSRPENRHRNSSAAAGRARFKKRERVCSAILGEKRVRPFCCHFERF